MVKVVIAGGGVAGLVCSYIMNLRRETDEVVVLEPGKPGGEFLAGGLKYIHSSEQMMALLDELEVGYSPYVVNGGMLLRGAVHPYPKCFTKMSLDAAQRIQHDHYIKTRHTMPDGGMSNVSMNDPFQMKSRRALNCDCAALIEELSDAADIVADGLACVENDHELRTSSGLRMAFDYLVLTIPIWLTREMVPFYVPQACAMKLNIAHVQPKHDKYAKWDFVYTPYTPADYIHRLSPHEGIYTVEANGELDEIKLHSDLHFIFDDGYCVTKVHAGLKGHLLPLEVQPEYPANIAPIGRFAKWDSRATVDVVLEDSIALAKRWFSGQVVADVADPG